MTTLTDRPPGRVRRLDSWRTGDTVALAGALALIGAAAVVGLLLQRGGRSLLLPSPPLIARWHPHLGWSTPLAVACVVVGLRLRRRAAMLPWRRLLVAGWLLNLSWLSSLALVDGLRRGWIAVLLNPNEYLHDLPRIGDPRSFLADFTRFIAVSQSVGDRDVWTTHVAGHPPLATLVFWLLARVGLGGGFWAGAVCILVASAASVAVPSTLRVLGARDAARRAVPFAALFPGAVWMAVSADGLFAGVATSGLALATVGAVRRRWAASVTGGVLLGAAVFLSYGLVLFGVVVVAAAIISVRRAGLPRVAPFWSISVLGAVGVAAAHLALGFNWFAGLAALRVRYYQGVAADRPFGYFVWANLAAWLISCSPLLAVGARRAALVVARRQAGPPDTRIASALALSGVCAALIADASALSKAETERIWLSFGTIATVALTLIRGRAGAWALLGSASTALLVNHLFLTGW